MNDVLTKRQIYVLEKAAVVGQGIPLCTVTIYGYAMILTCVTYVNYVRVVRMFESIVLICIYLIQAYVY